MSVGLFACVGDVTDRSYLRKELATVGASALLFLFSEQSNLVIKPDRNEAEME